MRLDDEIRLIHERYWETELQSALNKSVILVEGDDDLSVISAMLTRQRRTWATRIRVIAAGGRKQVLRAKSRFRDPFLLVDRDTWTDDEAPHPRTLAHAIARAGAKYRRTTGTRWAFART